MPAIDERTVGSLDRDGPTPLYRQLKWLIRRGIDDGRYRIGDRLPSENDFARTYAVSRHLVRQALLSLVAEGQVVARQGDGYYVNARRVRRELPVLTGYTAAMHRLDSSSQVKVLRQELSSEPDAGGGPGTARGGSQVVLIERLAYMASEPVALLADYFHRRFADTLLHADLDDRPLYEFVEKRTGVRGVRAPTVVSVDPPLPVYLFRLLLYEIDPIVAPIATLQILVTFVVLAVALRTVRTTEVVGTGK